MHPNIKANPLYISIVLLVFSYLIGEFIFPKYNLIYLINIFGLLGLLLSSIFFFTAFNLFSSYKENPKPATDTKRLIKTGIFAYTRNPIYISFILFHFSMFLVFENVMYFLSSIALAIWLHHWVIKSEEEYLQAKFKEEYTRYKNSVKRWFLI
mgnify:CR=1 FL=1